MAMDGVDRDKVRAAEAARHRRLFELLNQGELQANKLRPGDRDPFLTTPAIEDFAAMARRSIESPPEPPRRRFWQI